MFGRLSHIADRAKQVKLFALLVCFCAIFAGCKNTVLYSSVPSMPVNMRLNIAGEYVHFVPDNPMLFLTFEKQRFPTEAVGYAGLLVCTGLDMQYHAYDLACPKCLSKDHHVEIDGMYATCPICGEEYEVFNGIGNPTKGISDEYLRRYKTSYSAGVLQIYQ